MTREPTIRIATSPEEMEPIRLLFREYADSLSFNLCFQNFERELAALPGQYAPPSGCLLLATVVNEPAGCVALKRLEEGVCEMKRLYVRGQYRGTGLGRRLVEQIIRESRRLGYHAIRLDTIPSQMGNAIALYRFLGFQDIPAYCYNPVQGALFLELRYETEPVPKQQPTPIVKGDAMRYEALIEQYLAGPALLRSAVAGMNSEQLLARPIRGKWSCQEVVCHLADYEPIYADRMKRVIALDNPELLKGDPELFAARLAYNHRNLEEELTLIESIRKQMARILRTLTPEDYQRKGEHSRDGAQTLEVLLQRITAHIPHHIRFIEEKRRAMA
jgi:GNAT superfamily N-acetyltransferase